MPPSRRSGPSPPSARPNGGVRSPGASRSSSWTNPEAHSLTHAEWLGIILEHEKTLREQKRFETHARAAHLRHPASVEDVDYRAHRGLDRALFLKLAGCDWIRTRRNLVITGPCGVGKSWLACALGQKACREDLSVLYGPVANF